MKNKFSPKFILLTLLLLTTGQISLFAAGQSDVATFQPYLDNLFTDKSCTELKPDISADNLASNPNYISLPDALKNMAMKIALDDWSETYDYSSSQFDGILGDWDSAHAKKYRVQLYEPYSYGDAAASLASITQYTNMNNPTGIVGDAGDTIYIMVRDEIPAGTTLYIDEVADYGLHDGVTSGTKLQRGLNIITCKNNNSHFFIYYAVPTVSKPGGSSRYKPDTKYRLSDIPPVKVHIEGGRLNGFFNYVGDTRSDNGETLYTPDTQDDFVYTVQRATNPMYDLVGRYVILHFHLFDTDKGGASPVKGVKSVLYSNKTVGEGREYNPVNIMASWDEMCLNERVLMGLQSDEELARYNASHAEKILKDSSKVFYTSIVNTGDKVTDGTTTYSLDPGYYYSDYFNNRLMGLSQDRDGLFMSATAWRMNFHINTVDAILTLFNQGDIWGPAHEYGHINQGPMNMAGTTEESNNIFSNVAVYFVGKQTSRSDFISSEFKIFQDGKNFLENGTWGTTRMFWQLWCYYHATGHNTKFYPRLYELLRNYPLQKVVRPGKHNLRYDQLQFAKMCCLAAEEDLTDFFTAWGFFVPMDFYPIEDYSAYDAYLTEADIQAVKNDIAAFKFKKNEAIILIDDRPGSTRNSYDGFPITSAGQYGGLDAFRNESSPTGEFSFNINMNTVTVTSTGSPGAGYIIRDNEGNLLGFSNSDVFTVSDELAAKLRSGEAVVTAVGTDNTTAEVTNIILNGSVDDKLEILNGIYTKAKSILDYVDDDVVGYLRTEVANSLQQVADEVQSLLNSENYTSEDVSRMIDKLSGAYIEILRNEDSYVKIETGNTYQITSNYYKNLVLTTDKTKLTAQTKSNTESLLQQWYFEPTETPNTYFLKNVETGQYINKWDSSNRIYGMTTDSPYPYDLQKKQNETTYVGIFGIASHGTNQGLHYNNGMTYWSTATSSPASMWTIKKIHNSTDEAIADKQLQRYYDLLRSLIRKYEELKAFIDPTDTRVGYFRIGADNIFDAICEKIQSFIDRQDVSLAECTKYYEEQLELLASMTAHQDVYIGIEPGASYDITNVSDHTRLLYGDDTSVSPYYINSQNTFSTQWVFETTDNPDLYALRNFNNSKYMVSTGLNYTFEIPMGDSGDSFGLINVQDTIGLFGISAYLDPLNSLVLVGEGDKSAIRLSGFTSKQAQWTIKKVHDIEYVKKRDALAKLMEHGRDLAWNYDYMDADIDAWWETFQLVDNVVTIYNSTSTTYEELQQWIDDLENNLAKADALLNGSEIVTLSSIGYYNDWVDDTDIEGVIRHSFSPKEEIKFEKLLTFNTRIDVDNIQVQVSPIAGSKWKNNAKLSGDLKQDYLKSFNYWETDDDFIQWFNCTEVESLDGFYTSISAKLQESGQPGDYDLILDAPCSGLYEIKLYSAISDYAIFDANNKIPKFNVEIYPNLVRNYGVNGMIIAGSTFESEDSESDKTIVLPFEFVQNEDLTNTRIYLPGIYFADAINVTLAQENETDIETSSINSATPYNFPSRYFGIADLSNLKDEPNEGLYNVTVSKNGAIANYAVTIKSASEDDETFATPVVVDGVTGSVYYNLQGQIVKNPMKGIYIRVKDGKAEKVIL